MVEHLPVRHVNFPEQPDRLFEVGNIGFKTGNVIKADLFDDQAQRMQAGGEIILGALEFAGTFHGWGISMIA